LSGPITNLGELKLMNECDPKCSSLLGAYCIQFQTVLGYVMQCKENTRFRKLKACIEIKKIQEQILLNKEVLKDLFHRWHTNESKYELWHRPTKLPCYVQRIDTYAKGDDECYVTICFDYDYHLKWHGTLSLAKKDFYVKKRIPK
jgi:hypothetical protein